VPKVSSNCSTINDSYGAVAAVSESQENFRYVPEAVIEFAITIGGYPSISV
jgi:hypothetical protein